MSFIILGNWSVRIRHVYREANRVADRLANMGVEQAEAFIVYDDPPASIRELLLADVMGVTTPRLFWVSACPVIKKKLPFIIKA